MNNAEKICAGLIVLNTEAKKVGAWVSADAFENLFCVCLCGDVSNLDANRIQLKMKKLGWQQDELLSFSYHT